MPTSSPTRGEVWLVDYEPVGHTVGREQAGRRPALVISLDSFNHLSDLVLAVPITRTRRPISPPRHIPMTPPLGGLRHPSTVLCEQVRCLSPARFLRRLGNVPDSFVDAVVLRLRSLMEP